MLNCFLAGICAVLPCPVSAVPPEHQPKVGKKPGYQRQALRLSSYTPNMFLNPWIKILKVQKTKDNLEVFCSSDENRACAGH